MLALSVMLLGCAEQRPSPSDADTSTADPQTRESHQPAGPESEEQSVEYVLMQTSMGDIVLALDRNEAPVTVENFLTYVHDGFYDGTIFHRVISNFMIQGGGFTEDMQQKPTRPPITNEWRNSLSNERGTIAMARTADPDSASAQFFINVADNAQLDEPISGGAGYAVFGEVIAGMDVVDAIRAVPTTTRGRHGDVPVEPVVIEHVEEISQERANQLADA